MFVSTHCAFLALGTFVDAALFFIPAVFTLSEGRDLLNGNQLLRGHPALHKR